MNSAINVQIAGAQSGTAFGAFLAIGGIIGSIFGPAMPVAAGVTLILWFGRQAFILMSLKRSADIARSRIVEEI